MDKIILTTPEELSEVVATAINSALAQKEPRSMTMDKLLDKKQVCEYLGISISSLEEMIDSKVLNPIILGERSKRFRLSEIETYLESTRRAS